MTIQEIKENLGVDITSKCRVRLYVYLRLLYTLQEKKTRSISAAARDLKIGHASLLNALKKEKIYSKTKDYQLLKLAFKTGDKKYVIEYNNLCELNTKLRVRSYVDQYTRNAPLPEVETVIKFERIKVLNKDPLFLVCENLRKKETYLNYKNFNEWTVQDWENYFEIIKN